MNVNAIAPLIAVIAYLPILVATVSSRPWQKRHVLFVLFLLSAMAWSLVNYLDRSWVFSGYNPLLFKLTVCLFALTAIQFHFFISSFYPPGRGRWLAFAYGSLILFVVAVFTGFADEQIYENGVYVRSVYRWGAAVVMLPLLVIAVRNLCVFGKMLRESNSPVLHNQVLALILGVSILVASSLTSIVAGFGGFPIAHYGNLLVAFIVSYAVVRHQLVDIRAVLRRGSGWVALVILSLGGFILLAWLVQFIFDFDMDVNTLITASVLGLAVSFVSLKMRDYLFGAISRAIQGSSYDYRQQLREFTSTIHKVFSLEEQGGELLALLTRAMGVKQAALLFPEQVSGDYSVHFIEPKGEEGGGLSGLKLKAGHPVVRYLEREQKVSTREDLAIMPDFLSLWEQERETISGTGVELFVPLISREHLIAILVVSKKQSGKYSLEDLRLLEDITRQVAESMEKEYLRERLQESEGKYRAIFEQVSDSIVLIDSETETFADFNDQAHENLGYTREEFAKLKLTDVVAPEVDLERSRQRAKVRQGKSDAFDIKHVTKNGERRDVVIKSSQFHDDSGREHVLAVWHDITDRKRVEEELREREAELSVINRSSIIISSSLDIQEIYGSFIEELRKVLDVTWAAIVLAEDGNLCFTALSSEVNTDWQVGERVPLVGSGTEWVINHKESVYEPDIKAGGRFSPVNRYLHWGLRSMVFLPLIVRGGVIGSFIVASRNPNAYTPQNIALLEQLAAQIAMPIENTRLYAQAEMKARVDELSGLFNRRSLDEMIDREIGRHSRYGGVFSLAILDLDSFKAFNDNYGHLAGDKLLQQVSQVIRSTIRGSDVAFRYGGDEFAILLPQTNIEAAVMVVERVCKKIGGRETSGNIKISASIGLAAWPADGIGQTDIIAAADRALYQAKRNGGNRVQCASDTLSAEAADAGPAGVSVNKVLNHIYGLTEMVDAKDNYTRRHTERVAGYALSLAEALGMSPEEKNRVEVCALLHDIGMIGVSDEKLGKPIDMSDAEWRNVAQLGAAIVSHIPQLAHCAPGIRHVRERYDGGGHPAGLKGDEIPLESRIVFIAEAFALSTENMAGIEVLPYDKALEKIKEGAGKRFDPALVEKFVTICEERFAAAAKKDAKE